MDYVEFENLIERSSEYLKARHEKNNREFGIGGYERYEYDLYRNEIWWSNASGPKVRGELTVVGSWSTYSETWLWAWANPHFNEVKIGPIDQVREFGEKEGLFKLLEPKWDADEIDAWNMTSVAGRLLEAQGAYRSPDSSGALFLLYDHLEFIPEEEMAAYLPLKRESGEEPSPRGPRDWIFRREQSGFDWLALLMAGLLWVLMWIVMSIPGRVSGALVLPLIGSAIAACGIQVLVSVMLAIAHRDLWMAIRGTALSIGASFLISLSIPAVT